MGIIADVCALVMVILGMFSKSNGLENVLCFIAAAIFMVAGAIYDHSKKKE